KAIVRTIAPMEVVIFDGALPMGDSKNTTMVFAQDFRVEQCALGERKIRIECAGVEILGTNEQHDVSSHAVYLDHLLLGRFDGDRAEFTVMPPLDAGVHRVAIHV